MADEGKSLDSRAGSHIESISAITLITTDMAAGVAFYKALGMAVRFGGELSSFTSLFSGTCYINLTVNRRDRNDFWGRVIFYVDDVDAVYRQITGAGYVTETKPADASWGERYFHIRDPDNHELSFARLLNKTTK